jgi:magnesium chelatase family protein
MEDGRVLIARARQSVAFPARFTLIAATNPCPCGHAGDPRAVCRCAGSAVLRYRSRLSGPLADRIDVHVVVGAVPLRALSTLAGSDGTSQEMRARVEEARRRQLERYGSGGAGPDVTCNAHANGRWLEAHGQVASAARELLGAAAERLGLSARAYHRVLKVARTIADLDGDETVRAHSVAEALRYRPTNTALTAARPSGDVGGAGAA